MRFSGMFLVDWSAGCPKILTIQLFRIELFSSQWSPVDETIKAGKLSRKS